MEPYWNVRNELTYKLTLVYLPTRSYLSHYVQKDTNLRSTPTTHAVSASSDLTTKLINCLVFYLLIFQQRLRTWREGV